MLNLALGLLAPAMKFESEIKEDPNYVYRKFTLRNWGNYLRFLFFMVDRDGESAKAYPMFFDGKVDIWEELPNPDNPNFGIEIQPFYNKLRHIREQEELDKQTKEEYKRNNNLNVNFFITNNNLINRIARFSFKEYLCKVFHINK